MIKGPDPISIIGGVVLAIALGVGAIVGLLVKILRVLT